MAVEPLVAVVGQLLLLTVLAMVTPLGYEGWVAGAAYAFVMGGMLMTALFRTGAKTVGAANRVTLARAALVGSVTALVVDSFWRPAPVAILSVIAAVALIGDAIDGQIARRTGCATPLGARFDMEVDAFLILVLSVFVSQFMGPWVLVMGAMRYIFVAASWVFSWLNAPLPHSMARKTVAAAQGIALVAAASGALPHTVSLLIVIAALGTLTWSFGRDSIWLYRSRA
ncbi:CDP-alcohol phosphatidyltransferase family protein [Kibdelosporangium philippinense]|uniref:CDP-alcohol phosphatidyltransferase family protein n=1 Tax=Kibdelosporangium philippinense TaxID=211113 RepID=A0ABS8Z7U5_9PSEU|nr:CDP-alcohol phosphatidyltransferase family protein [Kibdelosporangium philippinense]MCE7002643.1 CDP-alcohol phosphatidyltransferase family protein [Kibdelosporangium philippinense]